MSDPTYVATEDIFVSRFVRAFRKGEVVPASVVESLGCKDKVATSRTKAAKEALQEAAQEADGQPPAQAPAPVGPLVRSPSHDVSDNDSDSTKED